GQGAGPLLQRGGLEGEAWRGFRQGCRRRGGRFYPAFWTATADEAFSPPVLPVRYSCSRRLSSSISSASVVSLSTRPSILRTACSTVVWSRPPKRRPISGRDRSVSVLARYMAI